MIRIVEESLADKFEQGAPLLTAHWQELAKHKDLMVLNPDIDRYIALEQSGCLFSLIAYDGDKIVGYSVNVISRHLHYADMGYAQNDVLYIAESHRKGATGLRLIQETENVAKLKGAQLMLWHAKQGSVLERLMTHKGYAVQDIVFGKELSA